MKLNRKKIRWIISQKLKGDSSSTIAEIQGISARRVQQIYKEYVKTGQFPQVGNRFGDQRSRYQLTTRRLLIKLILIIGLEPVTLRFLSEVNTSARYLIT